MRAFYCRAKKQVSNFVLRLTLSSSVMPNGYTSNCSGPYWSKPGFLIFLTFGHSGAQDFARMSKIKNDGLDQYGAERFGGLVFATIRKNVGMKGLTLQHSEQLIGL